MGIPASQHVASDTCRRTREDNVETVLLTKQVRRLRIDPQPLFHFETSGK